MSLAKAAKRLLCLVLIFIIAVKTVYATEVNTPLPAVQKVTVTFMAGGGKPAPARQTIEKGERLDTVPAVTRTGYSFNGWYTDSKYTMPFSVSTKIETNTKIYAKWTKNPMVTFYVKGGKPAPAKQYVLPGEYASEPEVIPSRTGYVFLGWYKDARYTQPFNFSTPIVSNTSVYAKWAAQPVVSFVGGVPAASRVTVDFGDRVSPPSGMTKNGYTFDGWYTSKKYTEKFNFSKPVESKVTIYAKWIKNPVVKFSTKGKCPAPAPQYLTPEDTAFEPSLNIPQGYILEGWYSDSSCKREFNFNEPIINSVTVYANIQRISVTAASKLTGK